MPKNGTLILEQPEIHLHPKVQRRLMDIIYHISHKESKQFIFSTHSTTILDCLSNSSRIFLEKDTKNETRGIANISVNAALSKMDSESYPLLDIYCEDDEAKFIIEKVISSIANDKKLKDFNKLFNIITCGGANITYENFKAHQRTYNTKKIRCGYGCILDGDMKIMKNHKGQLTYEVESDLHFLYSNEPPEKFLARAYLSENSNESIEYHIENSNPHCLIDKIIENSTYTTKYEVLDKCWNIFINTSNGKIYQKEIENFILGQAIKYSPEL